MWDRVFDHSVHKPMQKVVTDRIRPEGKTDPFGVEQSRGQIREAYAVLDRQIAGHQWAAGTQFSLADCAAAPALLYAETIVPLEAAHENLAAYLDRLIVRLLRAGEEAGPLKFFPVETKPRSGPRTP
jgi:glutathione S-transferase